MRVASLLVVLALPMAAQAQSPELAGSVHGSFIATPEADFGASGLVNIWCAIDIVRFGGFIGAGTIPSGVDARNRVFMPLGASVALEFAGPELGASVRAYAGMWGGATQEIKLTAGGLIGGGAYLTYNLGAGITVDFGVDLWGFLGAGMQFAFAPSIGLSFGPAPAIAIEPVEEVAPQHEEPVVEPAPIEPAPIEPSVQPETPPQQEPAPDASTDAPPSQEAPATELGSPQ